MCREPYLDGWLLLNVAERTPLSDPAIWHAVVICARLLTNPPSPLYLIRTR